MVDLFNVFVCSGHLTLSRFDLLYGLEKNMSGTAPPPPCFDAPEYPHESPPLVAMPHKESQRVTYIIGFIKKVTPNPSGQGHEVGIEGSKDCQYLPI